MTVVEQATKLRALADAMDTQIEQKLNPGIARQNLTPRRARIAASMERDGRRLQRVQGILRAMATRIEAGTLPSSLHDLRTRKHVEDLLAAAEYQRRYPLDRPSERTVDRDEARKDRDALARIGISDAAAYGRAQADLLALLPAAPTETSVDLQIRQAERALIDNQIPGYFQTPTALAARMVELAALDSGQTVLEPSAGDGRIAEAIRRAHPDVALTTIEINSQLVRLLTLKGFAPIQEDCLGHYGVYDRILMNPPFERGQDIAHVRHAYRLLAPGGRLVAIVSASPFFRLEPPYQDFRDFLEQTKGLVEPLNPDTFSGAMQFRQTSVQARLVMIDKTMDAPPPIRHATHGTVSAEATP